MKYISIGVFCFIGVVFSVLGQDDLLKQLGEETEVLDEKIIGTFKGARLINGHSVETREKEPWTF